MSIKQTIISSIAIPALLLGTAAMAQDEDKSGPFFGETATGKWLAGVKYGSMQHDADGFSAGNNVGFMVGYEFSRPVFYHGKAAIEFEYLNPSSDGDFKGVNDPLDPSVEAADGEWSNEVRSLYMVYRGPGTLYFKGKAGLTASKYIRDPRVPANNAVELQQRQIREDKTTLGWGIGLGVHIGQYFDVELEYAGNQGNSDLNYISLGGNVRF